MNASRVLMMASGVILAAGVGAAPPPSQPAQASPQQLQQARAAAQQAAATLWQRSETVVPPGAAVARPSEKRVWVAAINAPGQAGKGSAGFEIPAISVGAGIAQAKLKATFAVERLQGKAGLHVLVKRIGPGGGSFYIGQIAVALTTPAPSTHEYSTNPFALDPGYQYVGYALVDVESQAGSEPVAFAVVRIPEIKWDF